MALFFYKFYSLLKAITGSLFAALFEGIKPEIMVNPTEITTRTIPPINGSLAAT